LTTPIVNPYSDSTMNDTTEINNGGNRLSTRQLLDKIQNCNGLYRHSRNGTYYAIKKHGGKQRTHSLDTTDQQIAKSRLRDWIADLDKIDSEVEKTTLAELVEKFLRVRAGSSRSTRDTEASIIKRFRSDWDFGMDMRVSKIKPSMLDEFLAKQEPRLKNTSYNRYAQFLKDLFTIAKSDKMIAVSPYDEVKKPWKKPQAVERNIPTDDQFAAIVKNIREQRFNADAQDSADFIEFMGLAGLGQAEASSLTLGNIDWTRNLLINIRRRKTGKLFNVPIYPALKPFLEKAVAKLGPDAKPDTKVFKIKDGKKAFAAACARLKYPRFTQRNLRQYLIGKLWRKRFDYKLISKFQGHQDGGKLILDTYTEVFGANDEAYIQSELAKLSE
jgi:integrase